MSNFPSMTALLGLLAVAGYQNREKLAELLEKLKGTAAGAPGQQSGGQPQGGAGGLADILSGLGGAGGAGGLGGLLRKLGGTGSPKGGRDELVGGGLGELVDRFKQSGPSRRRGVVGWQRSE